MPKQLPRRDFLKTVPLVATGTMAGTAAMSAGAFADEPSLGTIREPARDVPVALDCDVCVVGGSCTGVFAAVAAARLGAKVALIELNGFFGGVATAGLVNIWHSLEDKSKKQQIIAGLTSEVIERLRSRNAVTENRGHFVLNTEVLKLELDKMVVEAKIRPFLHTAFVAPAVEDGRMRAAIIEDKTGRRAIRAKQFIDASGDADEQSFGAVRVMVNCNQMGQAAGVAAWLALDSGTDVSAIDTSKLRATLKKQGAAVI